MSPTPGSGARDLVALEYLAAATRILNDQRLADPTGGLWEAADLNWWWRKGRHEDPEDQRVWFEDDVPVAAAFFTPWGETWGADLIGAARASSSRCASRTSTPPRGWPARSCPRVSNG